MGKYVATRKDICGGELIKIMKPKIKVFDGNGREISEEEIKKYDIPVPTVTGGLVCRGMLFNVNDNGLANDLIYTTPTNYRINGVESKVDTDDQFMIEHYVELDELLKYLNYKEDLTQSDLKQIYRKFIINNLWLQYHIELFGYKANIMGYGSGVEEIIPQKIYDQLSSISCSKNGKPHKTEPGYSFIKKRK